MADDKIVSLVRVRQPIPTEMDDLQEDMIAAIEVLLERIKKGEIVGIAYVADAKDDLLVETQFFCRKVFKAIGGIEVLKRELLDTIQ